MSPSTLGWERPLTLDGRAQVQISILLDSEQGLELGSHIWGECVNPGLQTRSHFLCPNDYSGISYKDEQLQRAKLREAHPRIPSSLRVNALTRAWDNHIQHLALTQTK